MPISAPEPHSDNQKQQPEQQQQTTSDPQQINGHVDNNNDTAVSTADADTQPFKYTFVQPHTLVKTAPMAVRMVPAEQTGNEGDQQPSTSSAANESESVLEPFTMPLPIPPNCKLYRDAATKQLRKPLKLTAEIPVCEPKHSNTLANEPPIVPTNAVNLHKVSLGYVYEDSLDVERTRRLISKVLLKSPTTNGSQQQSKAEAKPQQPTEVSTSAADSESDAAPANESNDDSDQSKWLKRVLENHPNIAELRERVYPLWRAASFGRLYDAGRKEIKEALTNDRILQIILQHLVFEGLRKSKNALEEESGMDYKTIDADGSLLHALMKEAIKKTEKLFDSVIADKLSPNDRQKKPMIMKDIDEQLGALGFQEEDSETMRDTDYWLEIADTANKHVMVEVDPISREEHFQAGSLNRLIEKLTPLSDSVADSTFQRQFMVTYQSFTTPDRLLTKLIQRFHVPRTANTTESDYTNRRLQIQLRVCAVIKMWIETHFYNLSKKFIARLMDFIDRIVDKETELKIIAKALRAAIQRQLSGEAALDCYRHTREPPEPKVPRNIFNQTLTILDVDEEEIARQLTLAEFDMYCEIQPAELLNQAWNKPKLKHRAPNVLRMTERFNDLSLWVASLIVEPEKLNDRKLRYRKVIKIAEYLKLYKNFNTLQAVLAGLQHTAVHRLKFTCEEHPKAVIDPLIEMNQLMNSSNNYKLYRETLKKSPMPCIPYLGVFLTDLTFIEDATPDFVKMKSSDVQLINWSKRTTLFDVITDIQNFQKVPFNFIRVHQIQLLLEQLPEKLTDEELLRLCVKREPRYADRTRLL